MADDTSHTPSRDGEPGGPGSSGARRGPAPRRRPRLRAGRTPSGAEVGDTLSAERSAETAERPYSELAPPQRHFTTGEAEKAEKAVGAWFLVAFAAGIVFLVLYWIFPAGTPERAAMTNKMLGIPLTVALLALGVGIVLWIKRLMPDEEVIDERHTLASDDAEREEFGAYFVDTAESTQITKRPFLRRTLLLAAVPLGLAPLFLLRDMGPLPGKDMFKQPWRKGHRMVVAGTEDSDEPRLLKLDDIAEFGTAISALPEDVTDFNETSRAALLLIRIRPQEIAATPQGRIQSKFSLNGVCAFSKICTHAGCPISLYEQRTHHLLCPCHQSTFDMSDGAKPIFGPAARPLPQLPIAVDDEGYLVADADVFVNGPIGPSFWERGRDQNTTGP